MPKGVLEIASLREKCGSHGAPELEINKDPGGGQVNIPRALESGEELRVSQDPSRGWERLSADRGSRFR